MLVPVAQAALVLAFVTLSVSAASPAVAQPATSPAASPLATAVSFPAPQVTPTPTIAIFVNSCALARVSTVDPVDSSNARPGDVFRFKTLDPIAFDKSTIIPIETSGIGVVSLAEHAKGGGHGGFLALDPRFIRTPDGHEVHVVVDRRSPSLSPTGKSNNIPGTVGMIPGIGLMLGAYGTFHRGADIVIPAGTQFKVFVGDEEAVAKCRR